MKPDTSAIYEPRTESVRLGTGQHVDLRDLHRALSTLNPFQLRKLVKLAGIDRGVTDPMDVSAEETVRDVVDICRGMPQYTLPVVQSGRAFEATKKAFDGLIRDRKFGTARKTGWTRPTDAAWSDKIGKFFWETRDQDGEFGFFVREDRKSTVLRAGQRFSSTKPYEECFLVFRTAQRRFYLRWPEAAPDVPAYFLDSHGNVTDFFPSEEDFEEIYPGWTYEIFGVQFAVPDLGVDYRAWLYEDVPDEAELVLPEEEPAGTEDYVATLLAVLDADPELIRTARDLSKHYRQLSVKWHPLKHLHASPEEKERINERYLELTNAYNALKPFFA